MSLVRVARLGLDNIVETATTRTPVWQCRCLQYSAADSLCTRYSTVRRRQAARRCPGRGYDAASNGVEFARMPTPTVSDDPGNHRVDRNFSERRHRHVSETVRRFSSSCHRPSVDESPAEALDPMEVLMATVNALRAPGPRMNCMAGFRRDHPRMVAQLRRHRSYAHRALSRPSAQSP
jgi:hypothetical protein